MKPRPTRRRARRAQMSCGLASALALALALVLAGCGSSDITGDSWKTHEDKLGFKLEHPEDWKVKTKDGVLITVTSPEKSEFVAIAPFLAPSETTPEQCLEEAPATFPDLLRRADPRRTRAGKSKAEAAATTTFRRRGDRYRANMLCVTDGKAGTFYAIGARSDDFDDRRKDLVRVLDSLEFTEPKGKGEGNGKEGDGGELSYETFKDPKEGSFTVEVPKGWNPEGGLERRSAVEVMPTLNMESPDGDAQVFAGDKDFRSYVTPSPTLEATGFSEGSEYSPGYGSQFIVRSFMTGAEFAEQHASEKIGCEGFEKTGGGEKPELSQQLGQAIGGIVQRVEVGDVKFRCSNDQPNGYLMAGTLITEMEGTGTWGVNLLYGYRATSDSEDLAREVTKHMVESYKVDAGWAGQQQQTTGNVSKIVSETSNQISESITSSYEQRQESQDKVYRDWSNYTLGQTDARDPNTGEEFKINSGHNYYWRKTGTNEVVGEDVGTRPDIDFQLLEEF